MQTPTIHELCQPRADVLEGRIRDEDFAADLSQVLKGTAPDLYKDPALFFTNTHPTQGLKTLVKAVAGRLSGRDSQLGGILRLDTSYGGGKTHALIGLHHVLTSPESIPNLSEFVDPATLPRQKVTVAAFDGENADPMNGRRMAEDILAHTPWGELAVQLAGPAGYARIRNSDKPGAPPPGAETLQELIGQQPALILLDELSIYLRKLKGPLAGQSAQQLTAFLTGLIKAVNGSPHAVLVFTLALGKGGRAVDAYSEENQRIDRIFSELQSVTGRQITALTPTGDEETVQVLCRRLFQSIDHSRVEEVVGAYQAMWSRHGEALPPVGQQDNRADELRKGYPLHPELIHTLMQKTSTLNNFQRVRGMLRLLAQTVGQLWRDKPRGATAIHLHHIDPGQQRIRLEITAKLGLQSFAPAIRADVATTNDEPGRSMAQQLDAHEFAGIEPYGSWVARTILFHSLAFNEPLKGLSRLELNYSVYAPGVDPAFVDNAVDRLREKSEYLDDSTTSKLRFSTEANLNQMVSKWEGQLDLETIRQELNTRIGSIFARQRFELVLFPASPADIPDDTDGPYLAILHWEGHAVEQSNVHLPELVLRLFREKGDNGNTRLNRNNLLFLCADALQVDNMMAKARRYLALQQMQQGDLLASLQSHQQEEVKKRYGQSEQAFAGAVQQTYRHVFFPEPGTWSEAPLSHAVITAASAGSDPGFGQKQVERVLRDAKELILPEDRPPAPNYMADKTPLRRSGVMSVRDLRNEYYRDPALPILVGDEVLKKCLRDGLDQGTFVYTEGNRLEGKDLPPGELSISEDAKIYVREKAEESGIWPPQRNAPEPPQQTVQDPSPPEGKPAGDGAAPAKVQRPGAAEPDLLPKGEEVPPSTAGERTGNIRTILTQWAQQVNAAREGIRSLTWRMNSGDGFHPLPLLKAEPGATMRVELLEGGWSSGDGNAEWTFQFQGTPEEALILRSFLEGQWRRGGEKSLDIKYVLTYEPPLTWNDDGEAWIDRLTRAGLATQTATIALTWS